MTISINCYPRNDYSLLYAEIQLTISIGYKSLDISMSMPVGFRNVTQGLLGNFNGVIDDDFILPDGTTLPSDLTDRRIYEDFGPKCKPFKKKIFNENKTTKRIAI